MITTLSDWRNESRNSDKLDLPVWPPDDWGPPTIGQRVKILAWGPNPIEGTVEGYEIVNGGLNQYVMVYVRPDKRPDWHKKHNPERDVCLFAGIELELI